MSATARRTRVPDVSDDRTPPLSSGAGDPPPADPPAADPDDSGIGRRRAAARGRKKGGYSLRRTEIINAAAQVFKVRGYQGTSLADIAEAVGTERASLYYYVSSKEELLDEVVTDVVKANLKVAEGIRDSDQPAPAKLRELITSLMVSYAENYPFLYVYLQENLAHVAEARREWAEEMRKVNRRWEEAVTAIVTQGVEEGTLRPVTDPRVMAYGLIGMVSWTNRWFNPERSAVDAATIGESYASMLLDGVEVR